MEDTFDITELIEIFEEQDFKQKIRLVKALPCTYECLLGKTSVGDIDMTLDETNHFHRCLGLLGARGIYFDKSADYVIARNIVSIARTMSLRVFILTTRIPYWKYIEEVYADVDWAGICKSVRRKDRTYLDGLVVQMGDGSNINDEYRCESLDNTLVVLDGVNLSTIGGSNHYKDALKALRAELKYAKICVIGEDHEVFADLIGTKRCMYDKRSIGHVVEYGNSVNPDGIAKLTGEIGQGGYSDTDKLLTCITDSLSSMTRSTTMVSPSQINLEVDAGTLRQLNNVRGHYYYVSSRYMSLFYRHVAPFLKKLRAELETLHPGAEVLMLGVESYRAKDVSEAGFTPVTDWCPPIIEMQNRENRTIIPVIPECGYGANDSLHKQLVRSGVPFYLLNVKGE